MVLDVRPLFALLQSVRPRELAEVLLANRVPAQVVAEVLRARAGLTVSAEIVRAYRTYVFDAASLTSMELLAHFDREAKLRAYGSTSDPDDAKLLLRAARNDPRRLAATLPREPAALAILLVAAGHAPSPIDLENAIDVVERHAMLRAVGAVMRGAPGDDVAAESYTRVVERTRRVRRELAGPEAAIRGALAHLRIDTEPRPLPLLSELSAGRHTSELMGTVVEEAT